MKKRIKCLMAALVAIIGVTANAAWTFYPAEEGEKGVLTDGIWTLHAELAKNSTDELEVNGSKGSFNGTEPSPINLTDIYDSEGKRYKAVSFETFSHHSADSSTLSKYIDKLTEFIAPDCRKLAGSGCFKNCSVLTNVYLNSSVTNFANHRPFIGCSSLKLFHPRELNIKLVPIEMFSGCTELTGEFSFPECTGNNGGGAWFSGCTKIESVKMPLMTEIQSGSFKNCSNLKHVEFSKELSQIYSSAFSGCISLGGDLIRAMLNPEITQLGNSDNPQAIFSDCSSFDGALEWNFPNLKTVKVKENGVFIDKPANIVGTSFFSGCTNLNQVNFITPVVEIKNSAFANIAPGAELYMPLAVPDVFGAQAVGNKTGNVYPKVYLKGNHEDWLAKMEENHYVVRKEKFNVWKGEYTVGDKTYKREWKDVATMMKYDEEMCTVNADNKVTLNQGVRGVLAFVLKRSNDGNILNGLYGFWVLKVPEKGLKVIVR